MKKILFIIFSLFMLNEAFPQYGEGARSSQFSTRKKEGYFNITQISIIMGNRQTSENSNYVYRDDAELQISPSLTMTHGGMLNEHVGIGIGTGFEIFDRNLFPIFGDIRYFVRDNDFAPFFALKIGYAISGFKKKHYDELYLNHHHFWVNDAYFKKYGGFMFNPEIGVKFPLSEKSDLMVTAAYRFQKIKSVVWQEFGARYELEYEASLNRLSFGAAVMFR